MSSKHRLYIALYDRKGRPGFHWGLAIVSKRNTKPVTTETGTLSGGEYVVYDITNTVTREFPPPAPWRYRERKFECPEKDSALVALMLVTKIRRSNVQSVVDMFRAIPPQPREVGLESAGSSEREKEEDEQGQKWNCVAWVKHALDQLRHAYPDIPEWHALTALADEYGVMVHRRYYLNVKPFSFETRSLDVRRTHLYT